jgi:hypothetical protein
MDKRIIDIRRFAGFALALALAVPAHAFELLTEGAMDSVSAATVPESEEIINIFGTPAAGLRVEEGYFEDLPLVDDSVQLEGYSMEDQSEELSRTLSLEVESWADNLRQTAKVTFEVGYVDQLPVAAEPVFQAPVYIQSIPIDAEAFIIGSDGRMSFQTGRVDQVFELIDSGVNSISFTVRREIDRISTLNAQPQDGPSNGSAFLSNLVSDSRISFSDER